MASMEPPRKKKPRTAGPPALPEWEVRNARCSELLLERQQLPIWEAREALLRELRATQVLVLVGETGSGKSTQLPQFLLESGLLGDSSAVAVTQPRRVAAMSLARRVAEEMGSTLGGQVGYSVRFDDQCGLGTRIKFCTDGLLLREALSDTLLSRYSVVIVDEAHERSVHTDVLLGLLKRVARARPTDFRLIVTSATLDAESFASFFESADVGRGEGLRTRCCQVLGRQFPVKVFYTPAPEEDYLDAALLTVLQVHSESPLPGDILVFLTGQEEIDSLTRLLRERLAALPQDTPPLVVAPLYAALPAEQQLSVFALPPAGSRKVVLATNIAETSLTIPGVRTVIDPGLAKQRAFNARSGADSLQVEAVSRGAARQRSGRAGREAAGTCYRLYTEAAFGDMAAATVPELLRANLGGVVLQLKALGISDPLTFPLIDPPPRAALLRALEMLFSLGALAEDGSLTDAGRAMALLPLEPQSARAMLSAAAEGCVPDVIAVLAMLSADTVFLWGGNGDPAREAELKAAQARFRAPEGDHATLRNVLAAYLARDPRERLAWCRDHYLSARGLARAADVAAQLGRFVAGGEAAARPRASLASDAGGESAGLRRALVAGYFLQVARRQPDGSYRTLSGGQAVHVHPSSVLFKGSGVASKPPYVVFNELVRTSKLYVRTVSAIDGAWLAELAPRFFKATN